MKKAIFSYKGTAGNILIAINSRKQVINKLKCDCPSVDCEKHPVEFAD